MTSRTIHTIQDYLTYVQQDGDKIYQIVNVELLLKRHPARAVISFLTELHKDYGKTLSRLLKDNKTSSQINEIVAKRFRIKMAINTIKNIESEEQAA